MPSVGDEKQQKQLDDEIRDMISSLTHRLSHLHKPPAVPNNNNSAGGAGAGGPGSDIPDQSHHHHGAHDEQGGIRIITMAGSNMGATLRSDGLLADHPTMEYKLLNNNTPSPPPPPQREHEHDPPAFNNNNNNNNNAGGLTTYLNSNFQAINNSIMLGGTYTTNDPGVHLDVNDHFFDDHDHDQHHGHKHAANKGKKKEIIHSD